MLAVPRACRLCCSLLVDAAATPVSLLFVDHTAKQWVDLTAERKKKPRDIDKEVGGAGR